MYHTIVLTTGVSLFTNGNGFAKESREFEGFSFDGIIPINITEHPDNEVIGIWLNRMLNLKEATAKPEKVSAEYSLLHALRKNGKLSDSPNVTLFHTKTFAGIASARLLKIVLEDEFSARVTLKIMKDMENINDRIQLNRALGIFMGDLNDELTKGEPQTTCFAPIGGYKVITSLGYLVGAFHGYPTAYLHQNWQILHEIPPVPFTVNEDFLVSNRSLIRRMYKEGSIAWDDLTNREKQLIDKYSIFFTREDELVTLNPFGIFLCDQPKYAPYFQSRLFISQRMKKEIDRFYASRWKQVCREIRNLIRQYYSLASDTDGELYHERSFEALKGKPKNIHLYKGSNKPVFRCVWRFDEKEDSLFINQIWFDHDQYEIEVNAGKGFHGFNEKYEEITEKVYQSNGAPVR